MHVITGCKVKNTETNKMNNIKILWADDEIDHLIAHLLFLEEKGYDVKTVNNGLDAIDSVRDNHFDLVFLG